VSFAALLTYRVEVFTRQASDPEDDEQGVTVETFVSSGEVPAWVEQLSADEVLRDRDTVLADWLVIVPIDTAVTAYDRILYGDVILQVSGHPAGAPTPRGDHHLELKCLAIEG
jgi:head-tail adaptor